jgi:hypothetical protein
MAPPPHFRPDGDTTKEQLEQEQARENKWQQQATEMKRESCRSLDDEATSWFDRQKGRLTSLHETAIDRMKQFKPDVWTPNAIEKDSTLFLNAITDAGTALSFADLENEKVNATRFKTLRSYFDNLCRQLGDYPDT